LQILDENGKEADVGIEGDLAMQVEPERPVGLFSRYAGEYLAVNLCCNIDFIFSRNRPQRNNQSFKTFPYCLVLLQKQGDDKKTQAVIPSWLLHLGRPCLS
jgi:hypothetical protein